MYRSFKVSNYRCFDDLTIAELERVNLIAGMNNVGKTALLEALFLHCGAYNPELTLRVDAFRGIEIKRLEPEPWKGTPWDWLFHQFDTSKVIEMVGEDTITGRRVLRLEILKDPSELKHIELPVRGGLDDKGILKDSDRRYSVSTSESVKVLRLKYEDPQLKKDYLMLLDQKGLHMSPIPPAPPFPAFFQGARMRISPKEEAEHFGRLVVRKEQDAVLRVLQLSEPKLERLTTVFVADVPMLYGEVGTGHLIPLPLMGEGMVRLADLVLQIGNARGGVMLVDEIENGLHHSILPRVWQAIGEVARQFDVQVFATTHSLECIIAAHRAFSENPPYDFRLHRLERVGETIRAVTYDRETLQAAIEAELEVR